MFSLYMLYIAKYICYLLFICIDILSKIPLYHIETQNTYYMHSYFLLCFALLCLFELNEYENIYFSSSFTLLIFSFFCIRREKENSIYTYKNTCLSSLLTV